MSNDGINFNTKGLQTNMTMNKIGAMHINIIINKYLTFYFVFRNRHINLYALYSKIYNSLNITLPTKHKK